VSCGVQSIFWLVRRRFGYFDMDVEVGSSTRLSHISGDKRRSLQSIKAVERKDWYDLC
jgi:hypothetical protein